MTEPLARPKVARRRPGIGYLVAVTLFCLPSFLPYLLTALHYVLPSPLLLVLGMASAAVSPFSFAVALVFGLAAIFRREELPWQYSAPIVLLLVLSFIIQLSFAYRSEYL